MYVCMYVCMCVYTYFYVHVCYFPDVGSVAFEAIYIFEHQREGRDYDRGPYRTHPNFHIGSSVVL